MKAVLLMLTTQEQTVPLEETVEVVEYLPSTGGVKLS